MNTARFLVCCFAALAVGAAVSAAENRRLRIEQTVEPRFPGALTFTTLTSGEARVVINVDAAGRLVDLLVAGYSNEAFADEAVRVLRQWTYVPATRDGVPVGVRVELQFDFSASGRVVSMTALDAPDILTRSFVPLNLVTRVCQPRELDRPVTTVQTIDPLHPGKSAQAPQQSGRALLDFYVDEQGQARMPVVLKTTNDTYAEAAVGALSQWRFATPTRRGKPVSVRVQQEFIFPGDS